MTFQDALSRTYAAWKQINPPPSKDQPVNIPTPSELDGTKPVNAFQNTALGLLGTARDIQKQRADDYDQPGGERSMDATVKAFNIITRRDGERAVSESEGWLLMQVLKDVRDRSTKWAHRDSLLDCVSYASLKGEARLKETNAASMFTSVPKSTVECPISFAEAMNFGEAPSSEAADEPTQYDVNDAVSKLKIACGTATARAAIEFVAGYKGARAMNIEPQMRKRMIALCEFIQALPERKD